MKTEGNDLTKLVKILKEAGYTEDRDLTKKEWEDIDKKLQLKIKELENERHNNKAKNP